jgi:alpha-glucosidase
MPNDGTGGRRWLRWLGMLGLVSLLVVGLGLVVVLDRVPRDEVDTVEPGRLTIAEQAVGEWQVESVQVRLDKSGLRLVDTERDNLIVWESTPDRPFVMGVLGQTQWSEYRGYFWPDTQHGCELSTQEVRSATNDGGRLQISGVLSGCDQLREFSLDVRPGQQRGDIELVVQARDVDALTLVTGRTDSAGVHGLGEQFAPFDLSGRVVPVVVREQGLGRGAQPLTVLADVLANGVGGTQAMTYAAWPSFVTGDVRSVDLDPDNDGTHAFAVVDASRSDAVALTSWYPVIRAAVSAETDPQALLERREATTRRPAPPSWVYEGAVVAVQGGTQKVRDVVDDMTAAGTELSAVWLQDWTGQRTADLGERLWWTWQLDEQRYPDWEGLVADLNRQGIRVLTYVNTWLVDAAEKGDDIRNLYAEAEAAGYLVEEPGGGVYDIDQGGFDAALVDLTNPAARAWYADIIATEVLGAGAGGFMADFGEGLPFDSVLDRGDAAVEHNRWPLLWAQTVQDACVQAGQPDCLTWFRAGAAGMAQEAAMFWNGDQMVTYDSYDGLASTLRGTFSAGVSGWPLVHSDIGGYTSITGNVRDYVRPPELNQRWAEMAAFGVMMRTHEGSRPAENAQVYDDEESRDAFARMSRLYAALAPYRAEVAADAVATGVPAIRHGWLEYPASDAARTDRQFFFGSSVLVAPVMAEGARRVDVVLPPGTWVHLLTGEELAGGGTVTVDAPLGTPAAFVEASDPRADDLRAMVARAGL